VKGEQEHQTDREGIFSVVSTDSQGFDARGYSK
jgi:hypothetical protein